MKIDAIPNKVNIITLIYNFLDKKSLYLLGFMWLGYIILASAIVFLLDSPVEDDSYAFIQIARSVVAGNGYMEEYLYAYRPPGYPTLLALAMYIGIKPYFALKFFMVFIMSSTIPLIWLLCRDVFNKASASIGAILAAGFPWFIRVPDMLISEGFFLPLFVLLLWLLYLAFDKPSIRRFVIAGFVCGIASLVREVVFYLPLFIFLTFVLFNSNGLWKKRLQLFLIFVCCEMLIIAPWTIRNHEVFDAIIPISTNTWINIYIGNNDRFDSINTFVWAVPEDVIWNQRTQPNGLDELNASQRSKEDVVKYIKEYPWAFVDRLIQKSIVFITPHFNLIKEQGSPIVAIALLINLVLYCFFILGFIILIATKIRNLRQNPFFSLLVLYFFYTILVAGITYSNSRYRLPLTTIAMFCTSGTLGWLMQRYMPSRSLKRPRSQ